MLNRHIGIIIQDADDEPAKFITSFLYHLSQEQYDRAVNLLYSYNPLVSNVLESFVAYLKQIEKESPHESL